MYHPSNQPISKKSSSYIDLNNFNYSSEPVAQLYQILEKEWSIKSMEISQNGQTGVLFIETTIGSFVLKMNNQTPIDNFFNSLARQIDLCTTNTLVVSCYEPFFHHLVYKIQQFCSPDEILSARLKSRMDFPFYQIIQYIPSISLLEVGKERFSKYQLSEEKLQSLGICLGYDLLTNNSDRLKLKKIWSANSQGNINNILIKIPNHFSYNENQIRDRQNVSIPLGRYCYIDHSGYLLDIQNNPLAEKNFNTYLDKVIELHDLMIQLLRKELPIPQHFESLVYQIELFTKYKLNEEQLTYIIEGIVYATNKFFSIWKSKIIHNILSSMKRSTQQFSKGQLKSQEKQNQYWVEYWNKNLQNIKLKHLQVYYSKLQPLYLTYSQIIDNACARVSNNIQRINGPKQTQTSGKKPSSPGPVFNRPLSPQQSVQPSVENLNENIQRNLQQNSEDDNQFLNPFSHPGNLPLESITLPRNEPPEQIPSKSIIKKSMLLEKLKAFQKKNYATAQEQ